MWNKILDALELHDSAVLTGFGENGFPFSVRCVPMADRQYRRLDIEIPQEARIQPGKASLLMHQYNEELWDLVQFLIRGTLVKTSEGYYFVPASISGSPRPARGMDAIRTLRGMRSRANAYIKRRGIDRPRVPWDEIQRLQKRADQWREERAKQAAH